MGRILSRFLPVAMLALAFLVAACGQNTAGQQASGNILMGVSGPKTGNNAQYGKQWIKGFDLALDEINGKGGIKGRKLEYDFEDSQSDPKQSVTVAQKFVADPRVVIELGDFSSPASMAASPIYQRSGLVQLGFTNSHPDFTKGGDYMWSNARNQRDEAPYLADLAVNQLGKKKLAVLYQNTDWGKTSSDLFEAKAKELGAEILLSEAYLPDDKNFRTVLSKAKDLNPDGLVLISYYNDGALIQQQKAQVGLDAMTVAIGSVYSPQFLQLGGNAVEGVHTTTNFYPEDPNPLVQSFVKAFKAKYNEDPDYFSAQAYDTVKIVAAVMEQYGTDRQAIKDGLAKIKDVPSIIYGKVSFNAERRVENPTVTNIVVKDGKFVIWKPTSAALP